MDHETFEREISMCRDLSAKNGGTCAWGECASCGVIPLLFKLGKGTIVEDAPGVVALRRSV